MRYLGVYVILCSIDHLSTLYVAKRTLGKVYELPPRRYAHYNAL